MEQIRNDDLCFLKAKEKGEPTFTLRAQDISAHIVLEAWVAIQDSIESAMNDGATLVEAVEAARFVHRIPRMIYEMDNLTEKRRGALEIAKAMMGWPNRKLAD